MTILARKLSHRCLAWSQKHPFFHDDVLKNLSKFTWKHLCQSLFFNKVAGLAPVTSLKRDSGIGVFLCEIFKNTFFIEHLWRCFCWPVNTLKVFHTFCYSITSVNVCFFLFFVYFTVDFLILLASCLFCIATKNTMLLPRERA